MGTSYGLIGSLNYKDDWMEGMREGEEKDDSLGN